MWYISNAYILELHRDGKLIYVTTIYALLTLPRARKIFPISHVQFGQSLG